MTAAVATAGFPSGEYPQVQRNQDQHIRQLVHRAQQGDKGAFAEIWETHVDIVYRCVLAKVGFDRHLAEDITSDTFERALKHIKSWVDQGVSLGAWLIRIAQHLVTDHYRRGRTRLEITAGEPASESAHQELARDPATVTDTKLMVREALNKLTPDQRDVLLYRFVAELSLGQTASIMRREVSAVASLQHRAVHALKRLLPKGLLGS